MISNVQSSLRVCANTIIPSVFPFLVINGILVNSGFAEYFGKAAGKPVYTLFGLNGNCATPILIGSISGFPAGAACTLKIYESGMCTKSEAEALLGFCNNAGPAFVIGAIGGAIWGNTSAGTLLYLSQLSAAFITGIILTRGLRKTKGSGKPRLAAAKAAHGGFLSSVPLSIASASKSMLCICGSIVFFSLLLSILSRFTCGMPETARAMISGFFEVTAAAIDASSLQNAVSYAVTAAAVGWSGVSVHMQVALITAERVSLKKYYIGKLIQSFLSVIFMLAGAAAFNMF